MDYEYERGYENGYIRARREVLEELKEEINNWIRQEMSELSYKELLKIKKESKTFWKDYYEVYRTDTEQSEVQNE